MGLDMNLYRKTYVKNWDHMKPEELHQVIITKNGKPTAIDPRRVAFIEEEMIYWRKANQIHRWFVENCQDGQDDCKEYYVTKEKLQDLLALVINVLTHPKKALELLPPKEGFFFGDNEVNEAYFEDLRYTKTHLESFLKEDSSGEYYYRSSW